MAEWVVEASDEQGVAAIDLLAQLEDAARWTFRQEKTEDAELSIALLCDATIERFNEEYLAREGPTDVISFRLSDSDARLVGDVYIGFEQAERQSAELDIPLPEELVRLVIHGTLHVLGWDHPEGDREGSEMFRRQEELVKSFLAGRA